jgi:alanine dehydrogenase
MPGAVPNTSTQALTNAILPYAKKLADQGFVGATQADPALAAGANTAAGHVVHPRVAEALGLPRRSLAEALGTAAPAPALALSSSGSA